MLSAKINGAASVFYQTMISERLGMVAMTIKGERVICVNRDIYQMYRDKC
jgi:hypothetical protein